MSSATDLLEALDSFLEAADGVKANRRKRRLLAPIERKIEAAMAKAFRAQGDAFAAKFAGLKSHFPVEEAIGEWDWSPLFDEATLASLKLFVEPLSEYAAAALEAGALQQIAQIGEGLSFTLENPRAVAYLEGVGADLVKGINDTTRGYLKSLVTQAVDEGWSYNRTAKAIIDRYAEFAVGRPQEHIASRAHLIAVTEAGQAYETGNRIVIDDLQASGVEMQKRWLSVGDSKVSDGCRENAGEGWIPAGQEHKSGHQHPLRFPGCRCDELYRRKPSEGE